MKMAKRYLEHFHHRISWLGISFLMLPILVWVWLAAREPFISVFNGTVPDYVMSGRLLSEKFDKVHAGFVLDQPTIGKWLFWFSVMAASSLPCAAAVGWLGDRGRKGGYVAFGLSVTILCVFLLCILSWPLLWLIQYVWSMGFTPGRVYGLLYAAVGGLLVIAFLSWTFKKAKEREAKPAGAGDALRLPS